MKCPHCERNNCPISIAELIGCAVTREKLRNCRDATSLLVASVRARLAASLELNEAHAQQLADLLAAVGRVQ